MSKERIKNYINHITFIIDKSGSMSRLTNQVIAVFDNQIKHLAVRSKEMDQETRVSVYLFGSNVECLIYDMDVLRLPSLAKHYSTDGQTALISGTLKAIQDLEQTPQIYGDHAFLAYALTDGGENHSRNVSSTHTSETLANKLGSLPENWTVAVLVPDQNGVYEAKRHGFPANNIEIWSTTEKGIQEIGKTITRSTDSFMQNRTQGIRGTKSLFKLNASNISTTVIKENLQELPSSKYRVLQVGYEVAIKPFVTACLGDYNTGTAYYQLTKKETVQAGKQICIRDKNTRKVYAGHEARLILGLPTTEINVKPTSFDKYDIFVQSTSVNRKLIPQTELLVLV